MRHVTCPMKKTVDFDCFQNHKKLQFKKSRKSSKIMNRHFMFYLWLLIQKISAKIIQEPFKILNLHHKKYPRPTRSRGLFGLQSTYFERDKRIFEKIQPIGVLVLISLRNQLVLFLSYQAILHLELIYFANPDKKCQNYFQKWEVKDRTGSVSII